MPYLKIQANRAIPAEQANALLTAASQTVASELGKPERYVMVELTTNTAMLFGGSSEAAAYLELKSIGLPTARTKALSEALCSLLETALGISPSRVYIEFIDIKGSLWGWNNSIF
jgi:phenylpyruvate tautomerase